VRDVPDEEVARDERFWLTVQQAFGLDARHTILNAGASDPMPRAVLEAVVRDPRVRKKARLRHLSQLWTERLVWVYGALRDRPELQGLWVAPNVFTRPADLIRLADELRRVAQRGLPA
jgi:hypothetical protein